MMLSSLFIILSGLIRMLQCIKGRQFSFFTFSTLTFCHLLSFCLQPQQCLSLLIKIMVCHIFFSIYPDKMIPNLLVHVAGSTQPKQSKTAVLPLTDVNSNSPATMQATSHQTYGMLFLFYCIYLTQTFFYSSGCCI